MNKNEAESFFTREELTEIEGAITKAEKQTSGEMRLYMENHSEDEVLDRAAYIFEKLEMHKTALRNGVLFYLSTSDRQFAIIGDAGINKVVPPGFWDEIKTTIITHFKNGEFKEGLCVGIHMAGDALKAHFPYHGSDSNELSNEVVFGKKHNE